MITVRGYFAVPEFKIIGCLNWKAAQTTMRGILLQNSYPEGDNVSHFSREVRNRFECECVLVV